MTERSGFCWVLTRRTLVISNTELEHFNFRVFWFEIKLSSSLQIYKYQNYNGEDFYLSVGKESNQISNWNVAKRTRRRNEKRKRNFCFWWKILFYFLHTFIFWFLGQIERCSLVSYRLLIITWKENPLTLILLVDIFAAFVMKFVNTEQFCVLNCWLTMQTGFVIIYIGAKICLINF